MSEQPNQPQPGDFCGTCGHFAARHGPDVGCTGIPDKDPCPCAVMTWVDGVEWPRPWLPSPEGLVAS